MRLRTIMLLAAIAAPVTWVMVFYVPDMVAIMEFENAAETAQALNGATDDAEIERLEAELASSMERLGQLGGCMCVLAVVNPDGSTTIVTPENVTLLAENPRN